MSQLEWNWKTWLKKQTRCEVCGHIILDVKLIRVKGELYHVKCWKEMVKDDLV